MSNARELTSAALLLSLATVASRLLGFVREMVIAATLGAGSETDAYLAAFAIPDVINHFLAGGALSAALLPIFAKHLVAGDPDRAWLLVSKVLSTAGIVLLVALGIGAIATEPILRIAYPGFDENQIALTARLTRIILPGPLLFTFGAIINATEQARKRFLATALTGLVYNACIIAGGLLGAKHIGVDGFSWGVVAGAALGPFLIPLVFARDVVSVRPSLSLNDPDVRRFFFLAAPLLLSSSLIFFDEWFQRHFASSLEDGAITRLNNARRLMLVPAAMVGQAIGQAAFAFLSRMRAESSTNVTQGQPDPKSELSTTLRNVFRATAALAMLTAAGVWATADASVRFAFLRGAYLPSDAARTTELLQILAWAVPGWSLYTVAAKALQAAERTWLSAAIGLGTLVPSWFVYQQLSGEGTTGLAWATVICVSSASIVSVAFLRGTYGHSLLPPALRGLLEGALLGVVGAGAAYLVGLVSPPNALILLACQGSAFALASGTLLLVLPGPAGDVIRRRLKRFRRA